MGTTTATAAAAAPVSERTRRRRRREQEKHDGQDLLPCDDECAPVGKLPWLNQVGCDENVPDVNDDNVFHSHWNWQLSYFQRQLTKLRANTEQHEGGSNDLMYLVDEEKQQHVYTVSLQSDEYRDIRMTYMSFPTAQIFRCLCYPRSPDIPIMGMGLMQFGGVRNMAIMDYQPLSSGSPEIQALYESELQRIRAEILSMSQPMSHKHFESSEERKYFTYFPLKGNWTAPATDDSHEFHRRELERAQHEFVRCHVELTQRLGMNAVATATRGTRDRDILKLHSDFDTFVSLREPAGKFLCASFGKEMGDKLVHNAIFPLSRN